ncbi:MAG: hypothetical protein U0Q12_16400 [Vicinamibacterales bacterium]
MSESSGPSTLAERPVLFDVPGTADVEVERDLAFVAADGAPSTYDLYRPRTAPDRGIVIIVSGYPDAGVQRVFGRPFKEMGWTTSWARLLAASGTTVVAYANREPAGDAKAVIAHVRARADASGVRQEVGLLACSGHGPLAVSLLMDDHAVSCATLLYGYTLDLDGGRDVTGAAATFKFVDAAAGRPVGDLAGGAAMLLVRAGSDEMPGLNRAMDRFVVQALAANLPLSLVNHPNAPHAFDLSVAGEATRQTVHAVLAFFGSHLGRAELGE